MQALDSMKVVGYPIQGIIHVGANAGQERFDYQSSGAVCCVYVEPIDEVFDNLKSNLKDLPGHIPVQAVCSDQKGQEIEFNIASNGGLSSSMLGLGVHAEVHPSIKYTSTQKMKTTTVDDLISNLSSDCPINLMIIDVQGAEMKVLEGSRNTLKDIDGIFLEVSEEPLYEGGCTLGQIADFMREHNFRLRWLSMDMLGHGDAFYCRGFDHGATLPNYSGNLALGKSAQQSSYSVWSKDQDALGALKGFKNGSFGFHTDIEKSPWWQVDLGKIQELSEIRIYNRINTCRERAKSIKVYISDDGTDWKLTHDQKGRIFGGIDGRPLRIVLEKRPARYVRVQLDEETYLHLDEVEIY